MRYCSHLFAPNVVVTESVYIANVSDTSCVFDVWDKCLWLITTESYVTSDSDFERVFAVANRSFFGWSLLSRMWHRTVILSVFSLLQIGRLFFNENYLPHRVVLITTVCVSAGCMCFVTSRTSRSWSAAGTGRSAGRCRVWTTSDRTLSASRHRWQSYLSALVGIHSRRFTLQVFSLRVSSLLRHHCLTYWALRIVAT